MQKIFNFLSKNSLILSILISSFLFVIFYPSKYINIDEHDYLNNARLIIKKELAHDCKLHIDGQFKVGDTCISKYNLGTSLFYIPAVLIDKELYPKTAFLTTFLIYLLGVFLFYLLLKKFKINPFFLFFYTFYPPLIYYSRSLFSETYSITFILLSFLSFLNLIENNKKKWGLLTGLSIGISILIRYTNLIPLIFLIGGLFANQFINVDIKKLNIRVYLNQIFSILITLIPLIIAILYLNLNLYHSALHSGYYYSGEEGVFMLNQFPIVFIKYFIIFNITYPLMVIFLFLNKFKYKWIFLLTFFIHILFYSVVKNITFTNKLTDLIFSTRLILPIIPLTIFTYVFELNKLIEKKYLKVFLLLNLLLLILLTLTISVVHSQYLLTK